MIKNPRFKSCKNCKLKFKINPIFPLQYVCGTMCAIAYSKPLKANKEAKELKEKIAGWKIDTHSKENKKYLQNEINKLARMIDAKFEFKCIDCEKEYGKQTDGAHFHSRGANCSLRYNLHNIHSADSQCNQYSDKHKEGYKLGLNSRYGGDYFAMIEGLPLQYKEVHLNNMEISEKLILTRKLIRDFNTFNLDSSMMARYLFNKIINIYK